MASKNLHDKPFSEETIMKLEIFEDYAQAWLPTFIMQKTPVIQIFDFFAGTGYDKLGIAGSPIRLLNRILEQRGHIFNNNVKINIFLNEFEPNKKEQEKFAILKKSCDEFMDCNPSLKHRVHIEYSNEDFETLFPKLLLNIKSTPSLVYLDQNQITIIPPEIGLLINLQELWLSCNQITIIPPEIGQLVNLQVLSIRDNQIKIIPPEIGQLINLQDLILCQNQRKVAFLTFNILMFIY